MPQERVRRTPRNALRHTFLCRGQQGVTKRLNALAGLLASVFLTLFGLVIVTFLIGRVMPIDPVLAAVGDNAPQEVVERVRQEMGLDQPLVQQFFHYVWQLLHGDLGLSVL